MFFHPVAAPCPPSDDYGCSVARAASALSIPETPQSGGADHGIDANGLLLAGSCLSSLAATVHKADVSRTDRSLENRDQFTYYFETFAALSWAQ